MTSSLVCPVRVKVPPVSCLRQILYRSGTGRLSWEALLAQVDLLGSYAVAITRIFPHLREPGLILNKFGLSGRIN